MSSARRLATCECECECGCGSRLKQRVCWLAIRPAGGRSCGLPAAAPCWAAWRAAAHWPQGVVLAA
eukprot:9881890-Heterocapsa_arctica.AAC.1